MSDANDNGAVFAISQGLRSDISAITTVNGQLGAAKGLLQVATAAATGISNLLSDLRSTLIQLADQNVTGNSRTQLNSQYVTYVDLVSNYINGASYNGTNLLLASSTNQAVIKDVSAGQFTILAQDFTTNLGSGGLIGTGAGSYTFGGTTFAGVGVAPADATQAANYLRGNFISAQNFVGTALNSLAAASRFIDNQITFNNALSDATTQGLGALVDADLAKESARLQSLQIKQQLGTQSLGIANQSPQILLGLFR